MTETTTVTGARPRQTFLTNHARVLLCVADDCDARMRDIARCVGVTERTAYGILCELVEQGYLSRERAGRRNCYRVHPDRVREHDGEVAEIAALSALLGVEADSG